MTRPSTLVRDVRILAFYKAGMVPKRIKIRMQLDNVWIVYDALKRDRRQGAKDRRLPIDFKHENE